MYLLETYAYNISFGDKCIYVYICMCIYNIHTSLLEINVINISFGDMYTCSNISYLFWRYMYKYVS